MDILGDAMAKRFGEQVTGGQRNEERRVENRSGVVSDLDPEPLSQSSFVNHRHDWGIDAPENAMPYGKEAKEELTKIVHGKCLRVLVYCEDQYGRCVADIYCDGKFVQELMLKKGFAWHYATYDQRPELARWENEARAARVGLWASLNPEKPWEWRRKNMKKGQKRIRRLDRSEGI